MSEKPSIRVYFVDFWPSFKLEDNFFYNFLSKYYDVVLDNEKPDYLFYSLFGTEHHKYDCIKTLFVGENERPNMKECDYALSFDFWDDEPRQYRMPHYRQFGDPLELTREPDIEKILMEKTEFCNFLYSNPSCEKRVKFFQKLSKYKKVDSGGKVLNNVGGPVPDKVEFLNKYKFTIAFENESYPGYTTEKVFEPMQLDSIPIYWGNPLVHLDFNPESFVNYYDFESEDDMIDYIIELDKDQDKYIEKLKQPYFHDNEVNEFVREENLKAFFDRIINDPIEPISKRMKLRSKNPIVRSAAKFGNALTYKAYQTNRLLRFLSIRKIGMKLRGEF
jgi:hypothetical protein